LSKLLSGENWRVLAYADERQTGRGAREKGLPGERFVRRTWVSVLL
jgi:hypothetical protein